MGSEAQRVAEATQPRPGDFPGDPEAWQRLRASREREKAPTVAALEPRTPREWREPEPVDAAALLDEVAGFVARYVAFPSDACRTAFVLWIAHTHALDAFESTPRLAFLSPEKGSGKTRALEVAEPLCPTPRHAVNMTAAALFRAVAENRPVVLFDESDTYFGPKAKEHEELRGLVNAGHRRGAVAYRCVGDGGRMEVKEFPAFCAIALAGIGDLPDTILDRSVVIRMKRRAPHEVIEPFRHRKVWPAATALRDRLAAWALQATSALEGAEPEMPDGITDRPADVWEPLLAIADHAGGEWPLLARLAAIELNDARVSAEASLGVRLLADCRQAFVNADKLHTEDLLAFLVALDEAPWGDLRGRELDARGLAKRLKPYCVSPHQIRVGDVTKKGYSREAFFDAWQRYLPPVPPRNTETSGTDETPDGPGVTDVSQVSLFRGEEAL